MRFLLKLSIFTGPDPPINLKAHAIKISKNVYNVEVTWAISNATIVPDYYILELTVILDEENFTNTEMTVPGVIIHCTC